MRSRSRTSRRKRRRLREPPLKWRAEVARARPLPHTQAMSSLRLPVPAEALPGRALFGLGCFWVAELGGTSASCLIGAIEA
jgi:hypothetical protein